MSSFSLYADTVVVPFICMLPVDNRVLIFSLAAPLGVGVADFRLFPVPPSFCKAVKYHRALNSYPFFLELVIYNRAKEYIHKNFLKAVVHVIITDQ